MHFEVLQTNTPILGGGDNLVRSLNECSHATYECYHAATCKYKLVPAWAMSRPRPAPVSPLYLGLPGSTSTGYLQTPIWLYIAPSYLHIFVCNQNHENCYLFLWDWNGWGGWIIIIMRSSFQEQGMRFIIPSSLDKLIVIEFGLTKGNS